MAPIPHVDRIDRREHGATMVVGEELDADSNRVRGSIRVQHRRSRNLGRCGWPARVRSCWRGTSDRPAVAPADPGCAVTYSTASKSCSMAAGTGYGNSVVSVSGQCNPGHARLRYRRKPASLIPLRRQYSRGAGSVTLAPGPWLTRGRCQAPGGHGRIVSDRRDGDWLSLRAIQRAPPR
jgi:hypothetical protein